MNIIGQIISIIILALMCFSTWYMYQSGEIDKKERNFRHIIESLVLIIWIISVTL